MPNWVYNYVSITDSKEKVDAFIEHISKQPKFSNDKEWVPGKSFSFHSFITPDDSITLDEYHGTHGFGPEGEMGDTPGNWYNWNTSKWDTKWDASYAEIEDQGQHTNPAGQSSKSIVIRFETAWSPPTSVFEAMCEQFPDLDMSFEYEEEQGWGGKGENYGGSYTTTESWDIPDCHQDYVDRNNEDGCACSNYEDPDDWYDDCPGKVKKVYTVRVYTDYKVTASEMEIKELKETIENYESGYDQAVVVSSDHVVMYELIKTEEVE